MLILLAIFIECLDHVNSINSMLFLTHLNALKPVHKMNKKQPTVKSNALFDSPLYKDFQNALDLVSSCNIG